MEDHIGSSKDANSISTQKWTSTSTMKKKIHPKSSTNSARIWSNTFAKELSSCSSINTVKFGNVTLDRPKFWCGEGNAQEMKMLPRHARLQRMTYASKMKVDVQLQVSHFF
jgi:DNA-directed RNA polymerase beta subunit